MTKRNNKTNTDLHNTTQKTNDWATTQTPLKPVWTHVFRKVKQFLDQFWHPSCFSCCKTCDKSWMRKGPESDYVKRNISVVICDTDIPQWLIRVVATVKLSMMWWLKLNH